MSNTRIESFFNQLASIGNGAYRDLRVASTHPLDGYGILYQETSNTTSYYCYENKSGEWYIQKAVVSGSVITYTYAKGTTDVATAWPNRASQSYGTIRTTFA